jgi:hypothetical protein
LQKLIILTESTSQLEDNPVGRKQPSGATNDHVAIDCDERAASSGNLVDPDAQKCIGYQLFWERTTRATLLSRAPKHQIVAIQLLPSIENGLAGDKDLHALEYRNEMILA